MVKVVPNLISIFRICLVPVFIVVYFTDERDIKFYAVLVYAVAGLSDLLDGYIARKYEAQSKLGMLLDPLGDKLMTFTVLLCITITSITGIDSALRPILICTVIIFFIKEVLMGIGGLILYKKTRAPLLPANTIGKASTFIFFIVCVALMLFKNIPVPVTIVMICAAMFMTLLALSVYLYSYIKIMKTKSNGESKCSQHSVQDVNETLP